MKFLMAALITATALTSHAGTLSLSEMGEDLSTLIPAAHVACEKALIKQFGIANVPLAKVRVDGHLTNIITLDPQLFRYMLLKYPQPGGYEFTLDTTGITDFDKYDVIVFQTDQSDATNVCLIDGDSPSGELEVLTLKTLKISAVSK